MRIRNSPIPRSRVIALPDLQYLPLHNPLVLKQVIDHCIERQPDLVLSMGDMIDDGSSAQFAICAPEMNRLTAAGIKWLPCAGNHEYGTLLTRATTINAYFTNGPWVTGAYELGHVENVYVQTTLSGRAWLILMLEWCPRLAVVNWAKAVIAANPELPVLLVTHLYQYWFDLGLYDHETYGNTEHGQGCHYEHVTTPAEGSHDGGDLWRNLIRDTSQIKIVMCGHSADTVTRKLGAGCVTATRSDGTICHQVLQDFSRCPAWGGGYVVEYEFDQANRQILASTYSPYYRRRRYTNVVNLQLVMP